MLKRSIQIMGILNVAKNSYKNKSKRALAPMSKNICPFTALG